MWDHNKRRTLSNTEDKSPAHMYERVGKVEQEQARQSASISSLTDNVTNLLKAVNDQGIEMRRGFARMTTDSKTAWPPLLTAGGLIIIIIGSIGTLALNSNNQSSQLRHDDQEGGIDRVVLSAVKLNEKLDRESDRSESARKDQDMHLQREMRDLDKQAVQSLEALKERLLREIELIDNSRGTELTEIRRRISTIESWTKEHDNRVVGLNAAQWGSINANREWLRVIAAKLGLSLGSLPSNPTDVSAGHVSK